MNSEEGSTIWDVQDDHVYKMLAGSTVALVLVGAVAYRLSEDWSWVDSIYFSLIAVTTVGFGDIAPSTDGSKIFTVIYVLTGISIVTTYLHARLGRRSSKRIKN